MGIFRFFSVLTAASSLFLSAQATPVDSLADGFAVPPHLARPKTFWHWINANVTREGITRDLEAMRQVGVGGVFIFDGSSYMPAGPAAYRSPLWKELMTHAIREGRRLGVDIGMHNAPGWSSSGGPWITPERSMQQLVWTETTADGGFRLDLPLPEPNRNEGYYRDAFVLAFPALPGEEKAYPDCIQRMTTDSGEVDKTLLGDGQLDRGVALARSRPLQFDMAGPVTLHAATVFGAGGRRLSALALEASDDGVRFTPVCTLASPAVHGIAAPAAQSFPAVTARFFRLVPTAGACELAEVWLHRSPRIPDWVYKANFSYRANLPFRLPEASDAAAIDPASIVDVTEYLTADGRLQWDAPAGTWTILRIGHTSTGKRNVSASAAGTGLECDKFSVEAVDFQFDQTVGRILEAEPGGLREVIIDSYETGMQNWSAGFPAEFARRAGYDIRHYLPAMTGRVVGDPQVSERFLYDVRRVMADVMTENYYGRMAERCHEHGLRFSVEGYGQGMFDDLHLSGLPDIPTTEFWVRTPWTPSRTVKMVASAAHVYGKPVVAAEAFTGEEHTSRWLEYPYAMKVLGDDMFAAGVNHFVFHRYAHQPHPDAAPGVAMGPFGFPFERTNTWFAQSRGWLDYLSRCQQMLRQGVYIADVLYFTGENSPGSAQFQIPSVPAGHNYDLVSAEVLLERVRVEDGMLTLPEGGRYRLLVLPPELKAVTPELMRKLGELEEQGAVILGPKPEYSPTLRGYPESDREVQRLADNLWNNKIQGKGRVFTTPEHTIESVFSELAVVPDFEYTGGTGDTELSWQHRTLPDGELYFVANRQRLDARALCSFRVTGRVPELWDAQTGETTPAVIYDQDTAVGRTRVVLDLGPAESVFVVFRKPSSASGETFLTKDGRPLTGVDLPEAALPRAEGTFTMSVWAKPDIELLGMPTRSTTGRIDETAKFYAISAAEGDRLYGAGHAMAGLAVGRNGAYVIERSSDRSPAVVVVQRPISGWTHFAVVYRDGVPSLYIDGELAGEGTASGSTVHPGIGSPPPAPDFVYHFEGLAAVMRTSGLPQPPSQGRSLLFEGNLTRPELLPGALDGEAVARIARQGVPPQAAPTGVDLRAEDDGRVHGLFWESGKYELSSGARARVDVAEPIVVSGPWQVAFQSGRGAPESIELPALTSFHRHDDPAVRHFSGTAVYTKEVDVPARFLKKGRRVVLDLGRVEVIAGVRVNGREAGSVWREPYRIDITDVVRKGSNTLEIGVTTLWPNRLIGDEQLPVENEYNAGPSDRSIKRTPDWFTRGVEKPGERITFQTWQFFDKDDPLTESGLLGPVRLLNPVVAAFER